MPRRKLPVRQYPPNYRLVGKVTILGTEGWLYSLDKDVENTAKFCGAWPLLEKKHRANIAQLVRVAGEGMAHIWLTGFALDIANNLSLLKGDTGLSRSWRALPAAQRRFMERWLVDVFRVLMKRNDRAQVIASLRTRKKVRYGGDPNAKKIPISDAGAGDLAEGEVSAATAAKARRELAKLDAAMFGTAKAPKTKKNRNRG